MNLSLLAGFLLKSTLWLVLCLIAWFFLGAYFTIPVEWLSRAAAHLFLGSYVEGVERSGTLLQLLTTLQLHNVPGAPPGTVGMLTPEVNLLSYGYSTPLLTALFLATFAQNTPVKILLGWLFLLPFQTASVFFTWLRQIAIDAGPDIVSQLAFSVFSRNLIALVYQFGTLVLPTLVPVLIWLFLDGKLMPALLLGAYLEEADPYRKPDGQNR